jgi:hypothetical protein
MFWLVCLLSELKQNNLICSVKEEEKLDELFLFLRQVSLYTTVVILLTPNLLDFIRPQVSSPPFSHWGGEGGLGGEVTVSKVTATTAGGWWMGWGGRGDIQWLSLHISKPSLTSPDANSMRAWYHLTPPPPSPFPLHQCQPPYQPVAWGRGWSFCDISEM